MRHNLLLAAVLLGSLAAARAQESEIITLPVLDHADAVYYDGYQTEKIFDADKTDGILRHSNDIYALRLSGELLSKLTGDDLRLCINLHPHCDNYDRVGNVNLALVPKGSDSYNYDEVARCEVARYITPFMNRDKYWGRDENNVKRKDVPFSWDIPMVSMILRDEALRARYDFWLESVVFGVPYDAWNKVSSCKTGHPNDVFSTDVWFETTAAQTTADRGHVLVPIYAKAPEARGPINLNNYREGATDELGKTIRTFSFTLPEDVTDCALTLINTNHGAGDNGEEYVRREHLVYFDGDLIHTFTPGGVSCEPYRKYNTQINGIYQQQVRDDWEEWSNWCPGAAVPNRVLRLGAMKAGEHSVTLSVPTARFVGKDGDFRPSLYLQGVTRGSLAAIDRVEVKDADVAFSLEGDKVSFSSSLPVASVAVFSADGRQVYGRYNPGDSLDLSRFPSGIYMMSATTVDGRSRVFKLMK